MFLDKSFISHIFLAAWFVLVAMETIMQNKNKEKIIKKYLLRNHMLYLTED